MHPVGRLEELPISPIAVLQHWIGNPLLSCRTIPDRALRSAGVGRLVSAVLVQHTAVSQMQYPPRVGLHLLRLSALLRTLFIDVSASSACSSPLPRSLHPAFVEAIMSRTVPLCTISLSLVRYRKYMLCSSSQSSLLPHVNGDEWTNVFGNKESNTHIDTIT